jgi:hypothetical protein
MPLRLVVLGRVGEHTLQTWDDPHVAPVGQLRCDRPPYVRLRLVWQVRDQGVTARLVVQQESGGLPQRGVGGTQQPDGRLAVPVGI